MLFSNAQLSPRTPHLSSSYSVIPATLLACLLLVGRISMIQNLQYSHMIWNLFLAWIPFLASLVALAWHQRFPRQSWMLVVPGAIWLLFLPNAPYLGTDFVHLVRIPSPVIWYDIGLLLAFTWAGLSLAAVSLSIMHRITDDVIGRFGGWLMVVSTVGLSGFGVYLGRFRRWNSWDILLQPQSLLADAFAQLAHPLSQPLAYQVSLVFAALLLVSYLTFMWDRR